MGAGGSAGGDVVRVGVLGAARIAPRALVQPARRVGGVAVAAIAARDPARARAFAQQHGIARWTGNYAALVEDPSLDAIYIALPNALHLPWARRALEAGKHVLCEKPLACNAAEAQALAECCARSGRVLMEAFHNRYHPLVLRMVALVRGGALGRVRTVRGVFRTPMLRRTDIRFDYALGGGATMDLGCYMVSLLCALVDEEPTVTGATARLLAAAVDRRMDADLAFASGVRGALTLEMKALRAPDVRVVVEGDAGRLEVINPVLPQLFHRFTLRTRAGVLHEHFGRTATYDYQLAAFVAAVRHGATFPTDAADAVRTLRVIDAIYQAAGLPLRHSRAA